jgi:hypothetical protein
MMSDQMTPRTPSLTGLASGGRFARATACAAMLSTWGTHVTSPAAREARTPDTAGSWAQTLRARQG